MLLCPSLYLSGYKSMGFCCELQTGCCGAPIRNTVNFAFCHFVVHGIFVTSFVFSNVSYPLFYYVDYIYGISAGVLIAVSILGIFFASLKNCQALRSLWAVIVVVNVITVIVSGFCYTVERWNDVITTAFTRCIRKPLVRDFPDYFWYTLTVIADLVFPLFIIYLIYITSYMCNKWKSYLFAERFEYYPTAVPYNATITVPSVAQSNAYPTHSQK